MVEHLAGLIIPEREICLLVINPETKAAITPVTLRKHFRDELDTGFAKLKVRHHMALMKAIESGNVTAMIWWDKTRNHIYEKVGVGFNTTPDVPTDPKDPVGGMSMLEVARRIAFTLSMGASMPKPEKKALAPPTGGRKKQPA